MIVPDVGGGFGSKGTLPVETPLVALAALRARPPGQVGRGPARELPRRAAGPRAARGGRARAGRATAASSALRGRLLADLGAYLLPSTPIPPHTTAMLLAGCYDIQAVEVIVTGARTEQGPDRALPRRRPAGGELPDRDHARPRRARARARPGRAAPPQPGPRVPVPDRARLDLRLRRLRALPAAITARSELDRRPRTPPRLRASPACSSAPASRSRSSAPAACTSTPRSRARRTARCSSRSARSPTGQGHETLFAQIAADRSASTPTRDRRARRHRRDRRGRRLVRQPQRRRWAAPRSPPRATTCSQRRRRRPRALRRPSRSSPRGAYAAVVEVERATGQVRVRRWSPSTTPAGSSTRCWPRAR